VTDTADKSSDLVKKMCRAFDRTPVSMLDKIGLCNDRQMREAILCMSVNITPEMVSAYDEAEKWGRYSALEAAIKAAIGKNERPE
jgi:hypothetical protein